MDEDELASRQVAGLMVTLDLVDQVAPDAVEHGHGDLAAAREWLAERLLALPSDDPMVAACSLVAWSDVFDLFATGPRPVPALSAQRGGPGGPGPGPAGRPDRQAGGTLGRRRVLVANALDQAYARG